jgi:hypothetical protein
MAGVAILFIRDMGLDDIQMSDLRLLLLVVVV